MTIQNLLLTTVQACRNVPQKEYNNGAPESYYQFNDGGIGYLYHFICDVDSFRELAGKKKTTQFDAIDTFTYMLQEAHNEEANNYYAVLMQETNEIWACRLVHNKNCPGIKRAIAAWRNN